MEHSLPTHPQAFVNTQKLCSWPQRRGTDTASRATEWQRFASVFAAFHPWSVATCMPLIGAVADAASGTCLLVGGGDMCHHSRFYIDRGVHLRARCGWDGRGFPIHAHERRREPGLYSAGPGCCYPLSSRDTVHKAGEVDGGEVGTILSTAATSAYDVVPTSRRRASRQGVWWATQRPGAREET